ncbi:MAG TPA: hypothetical protein PKC76_00125 [Saprospiraceae bacterium]|nr:hypothetical protein [Saprospiraceae bacterium]HMP22498.1 hypothetical protein [Saprospiraceae bacterium]
MNNRLEARRTRQNRAIALFLTLVFHIALIGGICYYQLEHQAAPKAEQQVPNKTETPVQTVSDQRQKPTRP